MNTYLITPKYILGSDSFTVLAASKKRAILIAKARIVKEDWHSPHGWDVYQQIEDASFDDSQGRARPGVGS